MTSEYMKRLNFFVSGVILIGGFLSSIFLLQLAAWSMESNPPFTLLAYDVRSAKAGHNAMVIARVIRDMKRNCSADFSRFFYDANGARFDLSEGSKHMNIAAIATMERTTPGILQFTFQVPEGAAIGTGKIVTSLDYVCNPWHLMWPIQVVTEFQVEVLP